MSGHHQLRLASGLVVVGILIPIAWYWGLRGFLRGEAPSPGAGAQYVFVLLASIALAVIALAAGSTVAYKAHRRAAQRSTLSLLLAIVGAFAAIVLATWLALVVFRTGTLEA